MNPLDVEINKVVDRYENASDVIRSFFCLVCPYRSSHDLDKDFVYAFCSNVEEDFSTLMDS